MSAGPIHIGWKVSVEGDAQAKGALSSLRGELKGTSEQTQQVAKETEGASRNFKSAAFGAATFASGVAGLVTSFDSLQKVQLQANKAALTHEKSIRALEEAQDKLSKIQEKGGASARDLQQAQKDVALAQEKVALTGEQAALAQGRVSDTYINFFTNLIPQVLTLGFGLSTTMTAMGISTTGAASAMKGLGLAMKTAFLTNPVGLILIGVATAIALVATNTGGLRDVLFKLGEDILGFLDQHLKPLADAFRWIIDNIIKPVVQFLGQGFPEATATAGIAATKFQKQGTQAFDGIAASAEESAKKVKSATRDIFASQQVFRDILEKTGGVESARPALASLEKMIQATLARAEGKPGARAVQLDLRELASKEIDDLKKRFGLTDRQMNVLIGEVGGFVERVNEAMTKTGDYIAAQKDVNEALRLDLDVELQRIAGLKDQKQALDALKNVQSTLREKLDAGIITQDQYTGATDKISKTMANFDFALTKATIAADEAAFRLANLTVSRKGRVRIPPSVGEQEIERQAGAEAGIPSGPISIEGPIRAFGGVGDAGKFMALSLGGKTVTVPVSSIKEDLLPFVKDRGITLANDIGLFLGSAPGGPIGTIVQNVLRKYFLGLFAEGGSFVTRGPTPILVGEKGEEMVNIIPLRGRSSSSSSSTMGGMTIINHFHLPGGMIITEDRLVDMVSQRIRDRVHSLVGRAR